MAIKSYHLHAQEGSIRWTLDQFKRACQPLVYIWWGQTDTVARRALYIGKSKNGLHRPLDPQHHRAKIRHMVTDVEFICCATEKEALELEARLIRKLDPIDNQIRPSTKGKSQPYTPRYFK